MLYVNSVYRVKSIALEKEGARVLLVSATDPHIELCGPHPGLPELRVGDWVEVTVKDRKKLS